MTKKLLSAAITAVAAITLMTATVFAAPSVGDTQEAISSNCTSVVEVNGEQITVNEAVAKGLITQVFSRATAEELKKAGVQSEDTINDILAINGGASDKLTSVLDSAVAKTADAKTDTKSLSLLTNIQELSYKTQSGDIVTGAKDVTVTWKAPITSGMTVDNVRVLHYSSVSNQWELIKPDAVDPSTGSITAFFSDLSPVAIVYVNDNNAGSGSTDNNGSVQTGDASHVAVYTAILAGAALAVLVCVVKRKRTN